MSLACCLWSPRSRAAWVLLSALGAACAEGSGITGGAGGDATDGPEGGGSASDGGGAEGGGSAQGGAAQGGAGEGGSCAAVEELCNGLDDDCDDEVDEDFGLVTCGVGECATMTAECFEGMPVACVPLEPSAELCDGLDNNCDGTADDGNPGGGLACDTGLLGVCAAGTTGCTGGAPVCNQNVVSSAETCDGLDNDCNGDVDPGCCSNLAPLASPSVSVGGGSIAPYTPAAMIDGNPACASGWAWVENGSSPAGDYFQLSWGTAVTIGSMTVDSVGAAGDGGCGVPAGRDILSANVQYWNGSSWVSAGTLSNQADYDFVFPTPVTTTMLRLYDVTASSGNGNSLLFEWYVYSGPSCVTP